eukprot:31522-Pelagococcus_subviridis.AAC.3
MSDDAPPAVPPAANDDAGEGGVSKKAAKKVRRAVSSLPSFGRFDPPVAMMGPIARAVPSRRVPPPRPRTPLHSLTDDRPLRASVHPRPPPPPPPPLPDPGREGSGEGCAQGEESRGGGGARGRRAGRSRSPRGSLRRRPADSVEGDHRQGVDARARHDGREGERDGHPARARAQRPRQGQVRVSHPAAADGHGAGASSFVSHWSPYDRVGDVNADP